ncbi:MAG: hypothetical protein EPN55_08790 [Gammaproteobacteria bacterium]|nr:MAG: hypothetical protein EPN55_08790 [Gammaproteobacteria bacterium]
MRKQNIFLRGVISLWVAISLLIAPLTPAFAAAQADKAPSAPHAVHESAAIAHAADLHADHGKAHATTDATGHKNTSCAKHEQCSGKCCATCAQCFTATLSVSIPLVRFHAVQSPVVLRLHDRLVTAAHDRPPAA